MNSRTARLLRRLRHPRPVVSCALVLALIGAASIVTLARPSARSYVATRAQATNATNGTDLGPTQLKSITFVVTLNGSARPSCLLRWARSVPLSVKWSSGDSWAMITAAPKAIDRAFDVRIDNYRTAAGRVIFAANRAASIPAAACGEISGVGDLHSFVPPATLDVPSGGLTRIDMVTAYDVAPLTEAGYLGQGETVVFIEVDGYKLSDLDTYASDEGLPGYHIVNLGKVPAAGGETEMDMETVHAIAPDAREVYTDLYAEPGNTYGAVLVDAYSTAGQDFPGAIYTASLGFCETELFHKADLVALNAVMMKNESKGSSSFASSGDAGGLDCTPPADIGDAPAASYYGVEVPAVLPSVTGVGGTSLTTDAQGNYVGETTWSEPLLAQGSGGGVSKWFARPSWQTGSGTGGQLDTGNRRQVPDVAADADPDTGAFNIILGKQSQDGGTSLASPMWAGFTAVIDQALVHNGKKPVGFFNPILYHVANSSNAYPPFHEVTVGGNDEYLATPGYNMVTGLGSPDVYNLARDLLADGY